MHASGDNRKSSTPTFPAVLLVDDGAPINLLYFYNPSQRCRLLIPNAFVRKFGTVCAGYGVRGKFTVLPNPAGIGRLDQRPNHLPPAHLRGFIAAVRQDLVPRFDITPELLTHLVAWNNKSNCPMHLFEDRWVQQATTAQIADYLVAALEILKKIGLPAAGITSPWRTGDKNEREYVAAIARAQWQVHRRKLTWYFLHMQGLRTPRRPWLARRDRRTGQCVVSIPANTPDMFWPLITAKGKPNFSACVDPLVKANGREGRLVELMRENIPLTILTHWPSLYCGGRETGLLAFEKLLQRMRAAFGDQLHWMTCSQLAAATVKNSQNRSGNNRPYIQG